MWIYIHRDGQQFGPYSVEQAGEYLAAGNLRAEDLAWHEGAADWTPLAQVLGNASPPSVAAAAQAPAWIPTRRNGATSISGSKALPKLAAAASTAGTVSTVQAPARRVPRKVARNRSSGVSQIRGPRRVIAARNIAVGALFFFGGSAATYFTYESAVSSPNGGTYFVAWGAIVFGGIQFLKGIIQFFQA